MTMASMIRNIGFAAVVGTLMVTVPAFAQVAGGDTFQSSLTSVNTWLLVWIPTACIIALIVCALGWMFHVVRLDAVFRPMMAALIIGSASFLIGLTGLGA